MSRRPSGRERRRLGLDARISRRDFVNGALVGAGAAVLGASRSDVAAASGSVRRRTAGEAATAAPGPGEDTFTGYGGVGDYARANGNTWPVVQAAHRLRDGQYDSAALANARSAGDFDVVVVGGGIAGLSAAHGFVKATGAGRRVLVLENHAMLGGEARQNEFVVEGERLLGPQGSNDFIVPERSNGSLPDSFFTEFDLPREYAWQSWDSKLRSTSATSSARRVGAKTSGPTPWQRLRSPQPRDATCSNGAPTTGRSARRRAAISIRSPIRTISRTSAATIPPSRARLSLSSGC